MREGVEILSLADWMPKCEKYWRNEEFIVGNWMERSWLDTMTLRNLLLSQVEKHYFVRPDEPIADWKEGSNSLEYNEACVQWQKWQPLFAGKWVEKDDDLYQQVNEHVYPFVTVDLLNAPIIDDLTFTAFNPDHHILESINYKEIANIEL